MQKKGEVEGAYRPPEMVVDDGAEEEGRSGEGFGGSPDPSSLRGCALRLQSNMKYKKDLQQES
jgi:hypothetical protein